ncbi:unannotated protein [freshwater metagenome]|uniref:Unannotated protein n=1 Tax=freshwater metagenome TaxID=449393 RepID=A0A6J7T8N2_9ZZZZ
MHESPRQLMLKDFCVAVGSKVSKVLASLRVGQDHTINKLLETPLTVIGADNAPEVLGRHDGGSVY